MRGGEVRQRHALRVGPAVVVVARLEVGLASKHVSQPRRQVGLRVVQVGSLLCQVGPSF